MQPAGTLTAFDHGGTYVAIGTAVHNYNQALELNVWLFDGVHVLRAAQLPSADGTDRRVQWAP
jgi:hypothetical protein